jgi:hypothetical protein
MKIKLLVIVLIVCGFGVTKQSGSAFAADDFAATFQNSKSELTKLPKETDGLEDR